MVELHLHSSIRIHGVMLDLLGRGMTLPLPYYQDARKLVLRISTAMYLRVYMLILLMLRRLNLWFSKHFSAQI
jgi:hypothetical protein